MIVSLQMQVRRASPGTSKPTPSKVTGHRKKPNWAKAITPRANDSLVLSQQPPTQVQRSNQQPENALGLELNLGNPNDEEPIGEENKGGLDMIQTLPQIFPPVGPSTVEPVKPAKSKASIQKAQGSPNKRARREVSDAEAPEKESSPQPSPVKRARLVQPAVLSQRRPKEPTQHVAMLSLGDDGLASADGQLSVTTGSSDATNRSQKTKEGQIAGKLWDVLNELRQKGKGKMVRQREILDFIANNLAVGCDGACYPCKVGFDAGRQDDLRSACKRAEEA